MESKKIAKWSSTLSYFSRLFLLSLFIACAGVHAGIYATYSGLAVSAISNKGDPVKILDDFGSTDNLINIGESMLTAGLTKGTLAYFDKAQSLAKVAKTGKSAAQGLKGVETAKVAKDVRPPFDQRVLSHLKTNAVKSFIGAGVSTTLRGGKVGNTLLNAAKQTGIETLANVGAEEIGWLRKGAKDPISYGTQMISHGVFGAGIGALTHDDPWKGAASGATGAMIAEISAEATYEPGTDKSLSGELGKLAGIGAAILTGQDASVAQFTANNAIENNHRMDLVFTKEGAQRQHEYEEGQIEMAKTLIAEVDPFRDYVDQLLSPQITSYQEAHQELSKPETSWQNRLALSALAEDQRTLISSGSLIPTTPVGIGLTLAPVVGASSRAIGQGAKTIFSKGFTQSLASESSHALRVYTARGMTSEAMFPSQGMNLLPAPDMIKHHVFNKFRGNSPASQKYRNFFKEHSIPVDSLTIEITDSLHKSHIHKAGNNWTTRWKDWIDTHPNASTKEVYQFGGKLMDEYGVNHLPLKPYRSIKEKK